VTLGIVVSAPVRAITVTTVRSTMRIPRFTLAVIPLAVVAIACGGIANKPAGPQPGGTGQAGGSITAAETTAAAPTGPVTSFADGTYEIGTGAGQVPPGKYKTTAADHCYWERLKGLSGSFGDVIANGNLDAGAPAIVAIGKSDVAFKTEGGCTWQKS
jgi:hypothetical protein